MKGDFTRSTFRPAKHYSGVLMQQGRVQLDADWNEQNDIVRHRTETEAVDVVGPSGAPKGNAGFSIFTSPATLPAAEQARLTALGVLPLTPGNFLIGAGRYYVDGMLCENDGTTSFTSQLDLPGTTPIASDGVYIAYLDVWQRHLTALDDPSIRETALGGPDTATRSRTVWQVKLVRAGNVGASIDCASAVPALNTATQPSGGRLTARAQPQATQTDPCIIPASAGYRRLENQLYRVEVHREGNIGTATFKWSRENGSVAAAITAAQGTRITVSDVGADAVRGFKSGDWVEIVDDRGDLNGTPGTLVQIDSVDPATRVITTRAVVPTIADADLRWRPKLRRWDQSGNTATANGVTTASGFLGLEDGVEVRFTGNAFKSGDYWLIAARTETGTIEWPLDASNAPLEQPPVGIGHHYARLAVLQSVNGTVTVIDDCRQLFPPLTAIDASDVRFDNGVCDLIDATTVQEALNALCIKEQGCCAITVAPRPGWEAVFDRIADGADAHLCFQAGSYAVEAPIVLRNKGHITISGCGLGTRIVAAGHERVFEFVGCRSVTLHDFYAEGGTTGSQNDQKRLNGVLTATDCGNVTIESVSLRCAAGADRAATCITVRNGFSGTGGVGSARIRSCDLAVGHQQSGILLVNMERAQVEDNAITVVARPARLALSNLLRTDKRIRAGLRKQILSNLRPTVTRETDDATVPGTAPNVTGGTFKTGFRFDTQLFLGSSTQLNIGGRSLTLSTPNALAKRWASLIEAEGPARMTSDREALKYINRLADSILLGRITTEAATPFRRWLDEILLPNTAVASQGIVVGGSIARDVRVLNNTIEGALQGVHIGVSHREASAGTPDSAGTVTVAGNTIGVSLAPELMRERHGIFAGNIDSLIVRDNYIRVTRPRGTEKMRVEGVRIFGHLGRLAIARENHLVNVNIGIVVQPLPPLPQGRSQWLVADNMSPGAQVPVLAPAQVRKVENYS